MLQKTPFSIALLTIIVGVFIAILFGANEEYFKNKIEKGLERNTVISQMSNDIEKSNYIKSEKEKNWRYYQRFHFHATGIGSISLAVLLFLSILSAPKNIKNVSAFFIAIGGFLYPFLWLFAGIFGPEMGRNEAKEAFAVFGYMGGVFMIGLLITLVLSLKYPLRQSNRYKVKLRKNGEVVDLSEGGIQTENI
ncbi:MAG: hypothetical protein H0V01_00630 [Bacteroidetes bacterium]|nr:hypothetical protein [Bacteroidota bacterium]HET6245618.1 hypothetical protein [Bacteroidia bacterium]